MQRKGFSLIELLIVVAIIAALVGVAVPFFQDNLSEAQKTKAKQDLDVVRNAITLHDAQNRPLIGTSLTPLLGRYLQELPNDPWGNEYAMDANCGVILSFGADAQAGGVGGDEDHVTYYKPPLKIQRVQYVGPWGRPNHSNALIITMTKPFQWGDSSATVAFADMDDDLYLLRNTRDATDGLQVSIASLNANLSHAWAHDKVTTAGGLLDPMGGIVALVNFSTVLASGQAVTPTMGLNFDFAYDNIASTGALTLFGLTEKWLTNGPLDTAIYGPKAQDYRRPPLAVARYGDGQEIRNRGVKIERY